MGYNLSQKKINIIQGMQINNITIFVKSLTIASLFAMLLISCKNEEKKIIKTYSNGNTSSVMEYPDDRDTLNFSIKNYYPDGMIKSEAVVVNGKYVGKKIIYFENGKIYQIDSLLQPCERPTQVWDGTLIRFNKNGTLSQRFTVRDGHFNGLSQHFDGNGILIKEYYLKNDTIKDGEYKEFWDNGKVSFKTNFKNDTVADFQVFFNKDGDSVKYHRVHNGMISFPYKEWLRDGQTLIGSYDEKPKPIIRWKWFDKNGKEIRTKTVSPNKEIVVPQ